VEEVFEAPKPKEYAHLPYAEEDFAMRVPSAEYEEVKRIEDEILEFRKENVKTYVIASGVMYGKGESIFNNHFKKAWLQNPKRLPYVGEGKNLVPTVHVTDLARMVKKVFESKPEKQYIFGIDNTKRPTQKKLIQAISSGIGTGLVESVDQPEAQRKAHPRKTPLQFELDWRVPLSLNLKAKPSSLFVSQNEEEEPVEFDWHCKDGLKTNIQKAKEEFCKERGLKPVKIFVTGPPAAGKSFFGKQLADHYNVPHVHVGKMLEEICQWDQERETVILKKREIKRLKKEEEERALKLEQEQQQNLARLEKPVEEGEELNESKISEKEAQEEKPPEQQEEPKDEEEEGGDQKDVWKEDVETESDADWQEIDIKRRVKEFMAAFTGERLPEALMNEAVRWRLNQNDCQNRGYVLDGYPKTYAQAYGIFFVTPTPPEKKVVLGEDGEPVP